MSKNVARLFKQFQPEHYELDLAPDREAMTFRGTVTVRGRKAGRPSQRITFHQKGLKITKAILTKHDKKGDQDLKVARINNQNSLDEVRLHTEGVVYPGQYTVVMEFSGEITKPMHGIYPCFFKHDGKDKILIGTQFESHYAREAFPCIDEPQAKATFELTLTTPKGETVISNTLVSKQLDKGDLQMTTFETTPRMSTYLLAFAYGDMGYKEAKTKNGVLVRSYATPDNIKLTGYSVDIAVRALEFFEDYFGVPYPLPKLDMLALPDFAVGGMENWGLLTYRETCLLVDPENSSIESKQVVALVVAHEVSHQWFGDLVTMEWWNDLWLNESFANLMEYIVIDALYPEWRIWEQFVSHETGSAKRRDSSADVQSIKYDIRHPDEISTVLDPSIVYAKGGSILRMLTSHIGEEAFRAGLQVYFKKHSYGNTKADDLWQALGAASGQDVGAFMDGWIRRPGYPLVTVDWQPGEKTLRLEQRRFLNDPSTANTDTEPWQAPLAATQLLNEQLLTKTEATASVKSPGDTPLLFNHDGQSYFLPYYKQPDHLGQIVNGIKQDKVDVIDRLLLLDNYTMLQRGGVSNTTDLLALLQGYEGETSESVWGAMAVAVGEVRKLIEGDEASEQQLDTLVRRLVQPLLGELDWEDASDDSAQKLRLRGLVYSVAAGAKVQAVLDEGLRRFKTMKQPSDLPASTRTVMYHIATRYGSADDFKKLMELHHTLINADEKEEVAVGLAAAKDPKHYEQLLPLLTNGEVRRQDLLHWFAWLLRNRYSREAAWKWLVDTWDWIERELSSDKTYSYFARYGGMVFSRPKELEQFTDFFESKKTVIGLDHEIKLGEADIRSRIAWRERNEAEVKAWLRKYKD